MSAIQERLLTHFKEHRLIFWYDEGGQMTDEFEKLALPEVEVVRLENNEFGLRYRMLKGEPESKFLVYYPDARPPDEENWLLDLVLGHYQFQTDKVALCLRELDLSLDFREVVERHLDFFQSKGRRDKLLSRLKETPPSSPEALVPLIISAVISCRANWDQILLNLLEELSRGKSDYLDTLKKFQLDDFLWTQMEKRYGYESPQPGLRDFLVLLFRSAMGWEQDSQKPLQQEAYVFLKRWQDSQQFNQAFMRLSDELAEELDVVPDIVAMKEAVLLERDVFRAVDRQLVHLWCGRLLDQTIDPSLLLEQIRNRRPTFWYQKLLNPYQTLEYACLYLDLRRKLQLDMDGLSDGIRKYSEVFYRLDQYYRKFCFHFQQVQANELLLQLGDWIERHYVNEYVFPLNNAWQQHLDAAENWQIPGYPSQRQFYSHWVQPFLDRENKVYVIISDAFRYEIGAELRERINAQDRYQAELSPSWGVLPSYTQLGMAALLPHHDLAIDPEKATVLADEQSTVGTLNRAKILSKALHLKGTAFTHDYFLGLDQEKGRQIFKSHEVIYLYHNVIDKTGDDSATEARVFEAVETAMEDLEKIIKKIARFNGSNMLITADHGFLFQRKGVDENDFGSWEEQGDVTKLHRRFVMGRDLGEPDQMKKFTFAQLALTGEGEVLLPKSVNRLRVKGAGSQFVHGGASLQEIVIPVLSVNKKRSSDLAFVEVVLLGSNRKITTNQISIRLYQAEAVEEKTMPRELELGFYTANDLLLSEVHRQAFGSRETDTRKRESSLKFGFITEARDYEGKDVYLRMYENVPGTSQKRMYKEVPFRIFISMAPDF